MLFLGMMIMACLNSFIQLTSKPSQFILLLLLPCAILAASEIFVLVGSLFAFFAEAPRRIQAIIISLVFVSRYGGSLVYYGLLPLIHLLCKTTSSTDRILHYEYALSLCSVLLLVVLGVFIWKALKYQYVTEQELDKECDRMCPERILHPYISRVGNTVK